VYFLATQGIPTLGDRSHDASMPKNNSIHISVLIELGLVTDRRRQRAIAIALAYVALVKVKYTDIAVRSLTCHTATGTHMPYSITQCYLPPGRGDIPAFTPIEAGTRLSDPRGMQG